MLDDLRLIESIGVNERTIVSWFDRSNKTFNFGIFHLTDQPNYISKLSSLTEYGYLTYVGYPLVDHKEASTVYLLYLEDLMKGNNLWEEDKNFHIPEETKSTLENHFTKPVTRLFTLIQGGE